MTTGPTLDALIIGAGPSGLAVASALSGLTPYYRNSPFFADDVPKLCEEIIPKITWKRSENPVALAFDYLNQTKQLTFKKEKSIKYLVITDGKIGGCWNRLEPQLRILSISKWMALPGKNWGNEKRPSVEQVTTYYQTYAEEMGLKPLILENTVVTAATRVNEIWNVVARNQTQTTVYTAKNLVLANGIDTIPKKMGIPGEELEFVTHRSPFKLQENTTVLIVGSGFSAADCVLKALNSGCIVHHIYRDTGEKNFLKRELNNNLTDHCNLQTLMRDEKTTEQYTPYFYGELTRIDKDHSCFLNGKRVSVDHVIILIGSQEDLSFLQQDFNKFEKDVDKYTYRHSKGLFAVGPLSGDNFVRLNIGGCFAAAHQIRSSTPD